MQHPSFRRLCALIVGALCGLCLVQAQAGEEPVPPRKYTLATGAYGGAFVPVGTAMSTLVKLHLQGPFNLRMEPKATLGAEDNVGRLREGKAEFTFLHYSTARSAWEGKGTFKSAGPQRNLRALANIWPDVMHVLVMKALVEGEGHVGNGTIDDLRLLRGQAFSFGDESFDTLTSTRTLMGRLGFDIDKDFRRVGYGLYQSGRALLDGEIQGLTAASGDPAGPVIMGYVGMPERVRLLEFTDAQIKKLDNGEGVWRRYVVPPGTYAGWNDRNEHVSLDEGYRTVAQPNLMAVNADVPAEDVYLFLRTIYGEEGQAFLNRIHPAVRHMTVANGLKDLPIPLHPGAVRFFEERGMPVPAKLRAP